jgi:drug/metabolite transporter (DMT)-like permease
MGQLNNQSDDRGTSDPQAAEALLRAMTQDIENLRQNLLGQLSQDVERLQREKSQLIEDIETLKAQRQQQVLQQQQLVRQIAPALINQLQDILTSQLDQLTYSSRGSYQEAAFGEQEGQSLKGKRIDSIPSSGLSPNLTAKDYNENIEQLIASLDSTLRATFKTLQQDLRSYQTSLSQQLGEMYSLEKQGEAILEALVNRLRKEVQSESSAIHDSSLSPPPAHPNFPLPRRDAPGYLKETHHYNTTSVSYSSEQSVPAVPSIPEPDPLTAVPKPQSPSKRKRGLVGGVVMGLVLVLLSFVLQAFQNVVISVIFNKSPIFGQFELGGFAAPGVGNALLILWLRMLVVVPLMAILATVRYPSVWREIGQFARSPNWLLFLNVLVSGFFLFLSQVLLYLALGAIAPGVVITIFFIYPIFTALLAWVLYGIRPPLISNLVIFSVLVGFVLITIPGSRPTELSDLGISAAAGAGIAFAFHLILTRIPAKKITPVPLQWINYVLILTFAGLCLAGPFPESWWRFDIAPTMWPSLIISSLVLGGITLSINLLSNMGLRRLDPARALILEATVPALTALLALVIIQSSLQGSQIFGMLIVTLGVLALNFEQRRRHAKAAQSAARSAYSSATLSQK